MPYTLDQLDFVGVHVGVAIPPAFIENKRRAEQFKKRAAELDARDGELKARRDSPKWEDLLKQARSAADGKDFAAALDLLKQVEDGLAAPDLPPPPSLPTGPPLQMPADLPPPPIPPPPTDPAPRPPSEPADEQAVVDAPPIPPPPSDPAPRPPEPADEQAVLDPAALPPPPSVPVPVPPQPAVQVVAPPAPVAQGNLVDAINAATKAAALAQETIRSGNGELMRMQNKFIDLQGDRKAKSPGTEFDALTAQMTQLVDDMKAVVDSQNKAVTQITAQQQLLAGIAVNAPDAPPAAAGVHQKATAEIAGRLLKGQASTAESTTMLQNATQALADGSFTAKAGVKVYAPEPFEVPSVLRDLISKLTTTTQQYRAAKQQIDPLLVTATGLLEKASAAKPLPGSAANDVGQMETTVNGHLKNFGSWNMAINNPWKGVRSQLAGLKKQDNLEAFDLFWRGEKLYDDFSQAYGEADEAGKNVIHVVNKLKLALNAAPASPDAANKELRSLIDAITKLRTVVTDPVSRLNDAKRELAAKKKDLAKVDATKLETLEKALTDANQDLEKVRANISALKRAAQEAGLMGGLLKSRFSDKRIDKKLVSDLKKAAEGVEKAVSPALTEGAKTEAALLVLRDEIARKRATLGSAASVEDTVRLQGALKNLPKLAGKGELFPANGVKKWKAETAKGGDKNAAKLFTTVTKAWEAAEKSGDNDSLDALDRAAASFLNHYRTLDPEDQANDTDTKRAEKCREAQRLVRKLRLKNDLDAMPEPPWTDAQATKAKQIEACALLENGTPAKPPSGKGESDSFFIKNADGKPAFIFKPKQGENVKEGGKEGEGVVREVLSSKFNQQMSDMIGVDFGVCPTGLARLESDSFAQGEKSKEKSRVGALQQCSENEGNLIALAAEDPTLVSKIKTEDVQKIAMLDFLTLQGDRNPDNILIKDVGGEKRLVPIDGGFAFPSKELFDTYSSGMAAEPKGGKTGKVESGKNGLMQLPQSDAKFTPEMLEAIDKIDPAAIAKGMKQANTEIEQTAPDLKGLVPDENIENMRRSALFLKKAAREFTVAELAKVYALDFKRVLAVPAKQLDKEIAAVIAIGKARAEFDRKAKADETEYERLGGDTEITKLGWDLKADRMLRLNWKRKIEILKKREQAPAPPPTPPDAPKAPADQAAQERELKSLGGDKEFEKVQKRPDNSPKVPANAKLVGKLGLLRTWKRYQDYGGDAGFKKLVDVYQANQYTPFDQLPKATAAAVAAFSGWSGDPYVLGLGGKVDAFKDFQAFKK